jgi:hypothetical protein
MEKKRTLLIKHNVGGLLSTGGRYLTYFSLFPPLRTVRQGPGPCFCRGMDGGRSHTYSRQSPFARRNIPVAYTTHLLKARSITLAVASPEQMYQVAST